MIRILEGDNLTTLADLPEKSVHMAVTSPPYYGLRSYVAADSELKSMEHGSERTPDAYIARQVEVFRAVRRVLRDDGTLFVNIGETYDKQDRVGIPERFALAMQADGWIWRDTIIWHKPAPMPTSVNGWRFEKHRETGEYVLRKGSWRTTTAHEYIFLFAKTSEYYCDREAVAQPASTATVDRNKYTRKLDDPDEQFAVKHDHEFTGATANLRSVWTIGPEPLKHSHYAAYPSELPRRCIAAGTSAKGVCKTCGAPWARVIDVRFTESQGPAVIDKLSTNTDVNFNHTDMPRGSNTTTTLGWRPTCACADTTPIPATIIDPYGGSGTSAIAATLLGRDAIMCELNPKYIEIMRARFAETAPLLMQSTTL